MARFPEGSIVSNATRALLLVILVALALAASSSQAQAGTVHNCPPVGRWSIAVWEGESGTAASDALAACGDDAVAAAYSLDAQSGAWSRWFAGKPDVSNLAPLSDMQGVLALGSATAAAEAPDPQGLAAAQAGGQLHNCPPPGRWSIAVWEGESGTAASDALAACGDDAVAAAYSLDAQSGAWSRWFAGKPDVSNLAPLIDIQGVLALGAATGGQPSEPTSGWWESTWTGDGTELSVDYAQVTGALSEVIHVGDTYSSVGDLVEGSEVRELEGEDIYGREVDMTIATLSGWHGQAMPDSIAASGTFVYPPTATSAQSSFTRTLKVTVHYEYDDQGQLTGGTGSEEFSGSIPGGIAYSGSATGTFVAQYGELVWTERVEETDYYLDGAWYAETVTVITPESEYLGGKLVVVQESVDTATTYSDGSHRESEIVILWQRDENGVCTGKSGSGVVSGDEVVNGESVDYTGSITLDYRFDNRVGWHKGGYSEERSVGAASPQRLPLEVIFIDDPCLRPLF